MTANLLSVLSDIVMTLGFIGGAIAVGRKLGWYQRKIQEMSKRIDTSCKEVQELDEKRQNSELANATFTSRYGEKIDNIGNLLAEVKDMLFKHMMKESGNK